MQSDRGLFYSLTKTRRFRPTMTGCESLHRTKLVGQDMGDCHLGSPPSWHPNGNYAMIKVAGKLVHLQEGSYEKALPPSQLEI